MNSVNRRLNAQANAPRAGADEFSPAAVYRQAGIALIASKNMRVAVAVGLLYLCACGRCEAVCKYSVRDVGFVNIHGPAWQLRLVKPVGVDDAMFEQWTDTVRNSLNGSNVGYEWVDASSEQGKEIETLFGSENAIGQPRMGVLGPAGKIVPLLAFGDDLAATLKLLLHSPARTKILDLLPDALCVIVTVESSQAEQNSELQEMAENALPELEKQMWTLEKPTKMGPVLVNISSDEKQQEKWLLHSLGADIASDETATVILYGQGRRLGNVLRGEEISVFNVVDRAKLCGHSCECDLDREWLYGVQFIHHWSTELERRTEANLEFDPQSALVIAEVSRMIQQPSNSSGIRSDNLGSGLVIHDLDSLDSELSKNETAVNKTESIVTSKKTDAQAVAPQRDLPPVDGEVPQTKSFNFRWMLLGVLAALVLTTAGLTLYRRG